MSNRVIQIQTSKIDARLAATRRQGSPEAFKMQLASIGEVLAANASVDVALEMLREAKANRMPAPPAPIICAITTTAVYKQLNKARVRK